MGLQNQLNDVSADSIPLLLVVLIANCVAHLRSLLFGLLSRFGSTHPIEADLFGSVGSGLAGLIVLAEQLNLNRVFSYTYCCSGGDDRARSVCVVCLRKLRDGEQVRQLECRHVFHKVCFDGWLDSLKFNCPVCRHQLVSEERVDSTRIRVGGDLVEWFSVR